MFLIDENFYFLSCKNILTKKPQTNSIIVEEDQMNDNSKNLIEDNNKNKDKNLGILLNEKFLF